MDTNDLNIPPDAGDGLDFENMFGDAAGPSISGDEPTGSNSRQQQQSGSPQGNQTQAGNTKSDDDDDSGASNGDQGGDSGGNQGNPDDPKDDPQRMQYWQSRHDKAMAELNRLKDQVESQSPILKYINENPAVAKDVYATVQKHLSQPGSSTNSVPGQDVAHQIPEKPTKPQKPSDYDPVEAVSNKDSSSYKYAREVEEYQEKLVEYNEALIESQKVSQQKASQMNQQQQAMRQQARALYEEAVYRHGMNNQDAAEFVKWSFNPKYTTEDLIAVYKANKNQSSALQQKMDSQNGKKNLSPPPPVADGSNLATNNEEISEDDPDQMGAAFIDDIFANVGMG